MDTFDCKRIFVGEILRNAKSGVVKICLSDQAQLKSLATRTWLIKGEGFVRNVPIPLSLCKFLWLCNIVTD